MPVLQTITWDSKPDYDSWGPDDYWTCDNWTQWHNELKKHFGKEQADKIWTDAWNLQGGLEHDYNWCKYEGNFNAYVKAEKLNASWWLPNILNNLLDGAENTSQAATNVTKVLKWLIPTLVIAAAIGLIIWSIRKFNLIPTK